MKIHKPCLYIALVGGIATGKSTVETLFQALGIDTLDADHVAREIIETPSIKQQLQDHFGEEIITNNKLNRAILRQRIFDDDAERQWLNNLIHPKVYASMRAWSKEPSPSPYRILSLSAVDSRESITKELHVDHILKVACDEAIQLKRVMERGIGRTQAQHIIDAQYAVMHDPNFADQTIDNDGSLEHLKEIVQGLHASYLEKAGMLSSHR